MRKTKRYDKHYTEAENRKMLALKKRGWTNLAIARALGRTKIGISRHLYELTKTVKPVRACSTKLHSKHPVTKNITNIVQDICASTAPRWIPKYRRKPAVWFYDDTDKKKDGYAFKVPGGKDWPFQTWAKCLEAVESLGYKCEICDDRNYNTNTEAYTRGIRVYV